MFIVTFTATTAFWCLAIVAFVCLSQRNAGVDLGADARQRGFIAMLRALNTESQPVTFVVEELRGNKTSTNTSQVVLLERQLPPAGELCVGIKKAQNK